METLAALSFDQALGELESIVQQLEGGGLTLEETVQLYQRGRALAEHCQQLLDTAELQVRRLTVNAAEAGGAGDDSVEGGVYA